MKRTILVSVAFAATLATVFGLAAARSQSASPTKSGIAPAMHTAVLSAGGSGAANGVSSSRGSADSPPTISRGQSVTPSELNKDLRNLEYVPANPIEQRPELEPPVSPAKSGEQAPSAPIAAQGPDMPVPIQNFDGMTHDLNGAGYPPDTVGDVGPSHFIQAVNTSIAIYNKSGGVAAPPVTYNSFWAGAGTGTPCDTAHRGDPTVVYDPIGNRWFVADFSWTDIVNGPYFECIAVSKTADPVSGGWWLYALPASDALHPWLNDYPKMGIWPTGLFLSYNMFDCQTATCNPGPFQEVRLQAWDRVAMEAGATTAGYNVDLGSTAFFSLQPSHFTGTQPPAGRPNYYVSESGTLFAWEVWKFTVDFSVPTASISGPTNVSQTVYTVAPATVATPQAPLDTLRERVMMQAQYKNIAGTESVWVNHTVATGAGGAPVGIQWAQINVTGNTVAAAPVQQQIYGNVGSDGLHRWMGSLAVDKSGNMALGYSVTNANVNPSIRYNGRLVGDGLNTLPQGEATLIAGGGSQVGTSRWGDYSAMNLDPNGCTFWYTTEYYAANGTDWHTRIGSFTYPVQNCTPNPPTAVAISRFDAVRSKQGTLVSWRTGSESQVLGFNVYRTRTAKSWQKVNATLIAAKRSGRAAGAVYRFVDRSVHSRSYQYRLQVVGLNGARSWYAVGTATR